MLRQEREEEKRRSRVWVYFLNLYVNIISIDFLCHEVELKGLIYFMFFILNNFLMVTGAETSARTICC